MKKTLFAGVAAAFSALLIVIGLSYGETPFAKLSASDVQSATLYAVPPSQEMELRDQTALAELVEILNSVKVYEKSDEGRNYAGQLVRFTLTLKDGTVLNVGANNPFLYINEIGYKTTYGPCQRLNELGNRLLSRA